MYVKLHENLKRMGTYMIKPLKLWGFTNLLGKLQNSWPPYVLSPDFSTEKYSFGSIFDVRKIAWKFEKDGYKYDKTAKTLRIYQFIRKVTKYLGHPTFCVRILVMKNIVLGPFLMYVKLHENLKRMGPNMIKPLKLWGFTNFGPDFPGQGPWNWGRTLSFTFIFLSLINEACLSFTEGKFAHYFWFYPYLCLKKSG